MLVGKRSVDPADVAKTPAGNCALIVVSILAHSASTPFLEGKARKSSLALGRVYKVQLRPFFAELLIV